MQLPASYIVKFQKGPDLEHFELGDKYDLLLDYGHRATVTLTTLVGFESDEEVGNDSFIGALATIADKDDLIFLSKRYYVLSRHHEVPAAKNKPGSEPDIYPGIQNDVVPFDVQIQIERILEQKMNTSGTGTEGISPRFEVKEFALSDGTLRYYAQAQWISKKGSPDESNVGLAAWIAAKPTLHILAVEGNTSGYGGLPELLNVVDLGDGKIGLIVSITGADSNSTNLVQYHDGANLRDMKVLQSISVGE